MGTMRVRLRVLIGAGVSLWLSLGALVISLPRDEPQFVEASLRMWCREGKQSRALFEVQTPGYVYEPFWGRVVAEGRPAHLSSCVLGLVNLLPAKAQSCLFRRSDPPERRFLIVVEEPGRPASVPRRMGTEDWTEGESPTMSIGLPSFYTIDRGPTPEPLLTQEEAAQRSGGLDLERWSHLGGDR
jgi:hypothetical protein